MRRALRRLVIALLVALALSAVLTAQSSCASIEAWLNSQGGYIYATYPETGFSVHYWAYVYGQTFDGSCGL